MYVCACVIACVRGMCGGGKSGSMSAKRQTLALDDPVPMNETNQISSEYVMSHMNKSHMN